MTITIADARQTAEAATRPERLAFKTATADSGQMIALDETEGIVTAIVSVTGTEDEVADIIVPGAYADTLARRRPKVCWAHSWEHPIGRVLHIEELLPGDDRLPRQTKDGAPWPTEAGALVATMQFNMRSTQGKEAFEAVRFYSESGECEYSIGYQVPPGRATRDKAGTRHIKSLELYELSVVLFGAHTMTGTIDIKTAATLARQGRRLTRVGVSAKDALARVRAETKAVNDFADGVMVAVYPDPEAADKIYAAISGADKVTERDDLHVTLAYLGTTNELTVTSEEVVKAVQDAVEGMATLSGHVGGIGTFPDSGDGAPTWIPVDVPGLSMLREQIVDALGSLVRTDHGFTPHMTIGYDIGLPEPVDEIPVQFNEVRVVWGTLDRRVTLGPNGPEDTTRVFETSEASTAEGKQTMTDLEGKALPDVAALTAIADLCSWPTGPEPEVKAEGGADRNRGNAEELRVYWTTGAGGAKIAWNTPGDFTRCVKLLSEHMTAERAKGYCANRHKEMTGMWPGDKDNKGLADAYDPTFETKGYASPAVGPGIRDGHGGLHGSYEERIRAVNTAVSEALRGELLSEEDRRYEWDYVSVDATWDDRVIATRVTWGADDRRESFLMDYRLTDDGSVELGEPEEVVLEMTVVPVEGDDGEDVTVGDALALAEQVFTVASAFHSAKMQTKAGRVLSGANERRLREAMENLLSVLDAAGVKIEKDPAKRDGGDLRDTDPRKEVDPGVDLESTAPAAQHKDSQVVLEVADLNATLARLGLPSVQG